MDENSQHIEYKGTGRTLRVKIVNLLYLIFIIMAFLYIPADFIDIFKEIDRSYKLAERENDKLSFYNSEIFKLMSTTNADSVNYYMNNYQQANESSTEIINTIELYKEYLIEKTGGYDENNFLENGRDYQSMEKFFLRRNLADTIRNLITLHKKIVRPIIDEENYRKIDSLLHVGDVRTSTGERRDWERFYFDKMPMAAAITILSKFQNDIRKTDNILIESYIRILARSDSLNSSRIRERLRAQLIKIKEDIYHVGDEIILQLSKEDLLRDEEFEKITALVQFGKETDTLPVDEDGSVRFYPYKSGKYRFTVVYNETIFEREVRVIETLPVLEMSQLPVLFAGVDNQLSIQHNRFDDSELDIEINPGKLVKKGGFYYARVKEAGQAEVSVYGRELGKRRLLERKRFLVKDLPDVHASVYGRRSGIISSKILKYQKSIDLQSNLASNLNLSIKRFVVNRIGADTVEMATNDGGFFNAQTRKIIDKAEKGDIYVFKEILVGEPGENEFNVPAIVLNIR